MNGTPGGRILVVRQDRLGDAVNAVAVLKYLRQNRPGARLALMVGPDLVPLFRCQPYVDDVIPFEHGLPRLVGTMARGRFDAVMMLKPSKTVAWSALLAGVRAKAGLGWRPYYPLTGFRSAYPRVAADRAHEVDFDLAVAQALHPGPIGDVVPEIRADPSALAAAELVLAGSGLRRPIAVMPANRGSSPNWPASRYAELVQGLKTGGREVAVIGGPGEEPLLAEVSGPAGAPVLGPGLSIVQLAALLSRCRAAVASSTGTLHLAAAVGLPTVGLFCAAPVSRPQRWAPRGPGHLQLVPAQDRCPGCGGRRRCELSAITVADAINAIGSVTA
ncbi:MAG: glycosyltransferase family 9 protein [Candidatus Edwardsbacteria bacterium]|jgi:ADP-heptose:LPS heptosyltransferase|nr:glycosyltransferase family 9 protein [Candidatus Edwardsbacteria bacterium]